MDNMTHRNNQQVRPVDPQQRAAQPAAAASRMKYAPGAGTRTPKKPLLVAAVIALVLVAAVAAWFTMGRSGASAAIDDSKYQAVFFTNGQVYFGKLSQLNGDYMRLKNVYYLQNKEQSQDETSPQSASKQNASDVELIKLGNEIHGPEDEMLVSKDQILFFENLKPAGTVSQTITNYQKSNK